jgi:lipid-A-disaccharide synthase
MVPKQFMVVAGEASGDLLAAELVRALRKEMSEVEAQPTSDLQPLHASLEPRFFGAGGSRMAAAGVELAFDMTAYAVFGLVGVRRYVRFRRLLAQLLKLAIERQPDAIICVDFAGFNRRFTRAIKQYVRHRQGPFFDWDPKTIQYVSPQVWASRAGRSRQLARDFDLLLSIFPFEKAWYSKHAPKLRVEFVGHPIVDRYAAFNPQYVTPDPQSRLVLLLPGSRERELRRHLPVMVEAARIIAGKAPVRLRMVLPNSNLVKLAGAQTSAFSELAIQAGSLPESLAEADLALASSGTVTLECAYFGVPTVVLYKLAWAEYEIAKRIVKVKHIAMPNLLAGQTIYPELIQQAATPQNIAREALSLLDNEPRRKEIQASLRQIMPLLGGPGAIRRAAKAIVALLCENESRPPVMRASDVRRPRKLRSESAPAPPV